MSLGANNLTCDKKSLAANQFLWLLDEIFFSKLIVTSLSARNDNVGTFIMLK